VQDTPAFVRAQAAPSRRADAPAFASAAPHANGTHLVQLGSFASEQGARRAWGIYAQRYPQLSGHQMVISEAVVKGKHYWRVSAAGFDRTGSSAMCGRSAAAARAASPTPKAARSRARSAGLQLAAALSHSRLLAAARRKPLPSPGGVFRWVHASELECPTLRPSRAVADDARLAVPGRAD
jgi:hypothetical protein